MKFEAFAGRGRGDVYGSRDFHDIVTLLDGRAELVGEVNDAGGDVRDYLAAQAGQLLTRR